MKNIIFEDLGLIDYKEAWDYQDKLFQKTIQQKISNRNLSPNSVLPTPNYLLFCEHPSVFTIGKSGDKKNLLVTEETLKRNKISFYETNRGGDITYHGLGQIVGYPILDLDNFWTDIGKYMRALEEVMIKTLAEYNLEAGRLKGATGVWLDADNSKARKICAMGVKTSHWVTMHGFALNINCDLKYFEHIIPCGIADKQVTSLEKELGRKVEMEEVKEKLKRHFEKTFGVKIISKLRKV